MADFDEMENTTKSIIGGLEGIGADTASARSLDELKELYESLVYWHGEIMKHLAEAKELYELYGVNYFPCAPASSLRQVTVKYPKVRCELLRKIDEMMTLDPQTYSWLYINDGVKSENLE